MRLSKKATLNWNTTFTANAVDDAPMDYIEFQQLCVRLHINDAMTAAKFFGLSWRTCQRYHFGNLPIPGPVARLLRSRIPRELYT
jgi:hypothetical protein